MIRYLLLVHLAMAPIVFSLVPIEHFEFPKFTLMILVAAITLASAISGLIASKSGMSLAKAWLRGIAKDPISIGVLMFLASGFVSTLTSISPRLSLLGSEESYAGLITLCSYAILFFATRRCFRTESERRQLLMTALFGGAITCVYAVMQFLGIDAITWTRTLTRHGVIRPPGTIGHPNFLGAYLVMIFALEGYAVFDAYRKKAYRSLAAFVTLAGMTWFCLIVSGSRGAWIACASVVALLSAALFKMGKKRAGRLLAGAIPLTVVLIGLLVWFLGTDSVGSDPTSNQVLNLIVDRAKILFAIDNRPNYWKSALHIFFDHPIFGSGLETFQIMFQRTRTPLYWLGEWAGSPTRAHNELLQVAATQGLFGLIALFVLLAGMAKKIVTLWRDQSLLPFQRANLVILASGILGFLVQDLFSFTVSELGILFLTFAALLSTATQVRTETEIERSLGFTRYGYVLGVSVLLTVFVFFHNILPQSLQDVGDFAVLAGFALFFGFALYWYEACHVESKAVLLEAQSLRTLGLAATWCVCTVFCFWHLVLPFVASMSANDGKVLLASSPDTAVSYLERAVMLNRRSEELTAAVGYAARDISLRTQDAASHSSYAQLGIRAFSKAVKLVPEQTNSHYMLGIMLLEEACTHGKTPSELADAYRELEFAIQREPFNPVYLTGVTGTSIQCGQYPQARKYAAMALAAYPEYALPRYQAAYLKLVAKEYPEALEYYEGALKGKQFPASKEDMLFTEKARARVLQDIAKIRKELAEKEKAAGA